MEEIVHLRIKKEYAAELIKDLIQANALEYVENEDMHIPEWQKKAVLETLAKVQEGNIKLQTWEEIKQRYKTK